MPQDNAQISCGETLSQAPEVFPADGEHNIEERKRRRRSGGEGGGGGGGGKGKEEEVVKGRKCKKGENSISPICT